MKRCSVAGSLEDAPEYLSNKQVEQIQMRLVVLARTVNIGICHAGGLSGFFGIEIGLSVA